VKTKTNVAKTKVAKTKVAKSKVAKSNVAKTNVAKTKPGLVGKRLAGKRVAGKVVGSSQPAKSANGVAPTSAAFLPSSKKWKDDAFGVEHTKPANSRAVIRATEGKRWTARQQGRG
jgi:hypothetical protein